jgi:hypothetical protein
LWSNPQEARGHRVHLCSPSSSDLWGREEGVKEERRKLGSWKSVTRSLSLRTFRYHDIYSFSLDLINFPKRNLWILLLLMEWGGGVWYKPSDQYSKSQMSVGEGFHLLWELVPNIHIFSTLFQQIPNWAW